MSSGPVRRVLTRQDIQLVQNLIERCLQLYMSQKEVVDTLLDQAKIEPGFTELVWQKLEEENQEFFNAYYLRLVVKQQIIEFNDLLEQQVEKMRQLHQSGVTSLPTSNGSHVQPVQQNTTYAGPPIKQENIHLPIGGSLPSSFNNGGMSLHTSVHSGVNMSAPSNRIDVQPSILSAQSSNVNVIQGLNGGMVKSEAGYSGGSYMFGANGNVLEERPAIDTSVVHFSSIESNAQPLNEALLEPDISSFGFLGLIPRSFSFSDLTADFSQSSDILESYARSPFLATDADNFLDARDKEHQGDNKRLDTISEGLSYEDFGSE